MPLAILCWGKIHLREAFIGNRNIRLLIAQTEPPRANKNSTDSGGFEWKQTGFSPTVGNSTDTWVVQLNVGRQRSCAVENSLSGRLESRTEPTRNQGGNPGLLRCLGKIHRQRAPHYCSGVESRVRQSSCRRSDSCSNLGRS